MHTSYQADREADSSLSFLFFHVHYCLLIQWLHLLFHFAFALSFLLFVMLVGFRSGLTGFGKGSSDIIIYFRASVFNITGYGYESSYNRTNE